MQNTTEPRQPGLFDLPAPAKPFPPVFGRKDPKTSKLAGEAVERSGAIARQSQEILDFMRANPLAQSSAEIANRAGLDRYNVARRLPMMEWQGLVQREGVRHCAIGGRLAITWRPR